MNKSTTKKICVMCGLNFSSKDHRYALCEDCVRHCERCNRELDGEGLPLSISENEQIYVCANCFIFSTIGVEQ